MKTLLGLALAVALGTPTLAGAVDIEPYIRNDKFTDITISPNGEYFAAVVPLDDRSTLVMIRRSDNTLTGHFSLGRNTYIHDFEWVSDKRVVISVEEKIGSLDNPRPTGDLYAMNADNTSVEILVGQSVQPTPGTHIQPKPAEDVAADLVDDLIGDDQYAIIATTPFLADAYSKAERIDVFTGRRHPILSAPIRNADFATDNKGQVRFAYGTGSDTVSRLFLRDGDGWKAINNQEATGRIETPIGFASDDRTAYLRVSQSKGPDRIVAYDTVDGTRHDVLAHERVDPGRIIYRPGSHVPVGAYFADAKVESRFFEPLTPQARLYKALEAAFGDADVVVTSETSDGKTALVHVSNGQNPGDFYLVDTATKKASYLLASRDWFDPDKMNPVDAVDIVARDGTTLRGYVTYPAGKPRQGLPLVVMPHGGPFQDRDYRSFNYETQLLASAGYAVLQVNFRGSPGYGRAFKEAGAQEWGGLMQDDVTDATRWAIGKGIAKSDAVCIFGASYGGYAALMGAAKEPVLYRCAAGYVGVYDLPRMYSSGDTRETDSGKAYLASWIGPREKLAAVSPVNLADRIKVPVFLAAGGEDWRAPIEHTKAMEAALRKAGTPVEALYYRTEGHGFYEMEHRREFYTRLLAFLSRNLGGEGATGSGPTAK